MKRHEKERHEVFHCWLYLYISFLCLNLTSLTLFYFLFYSFFFSLFFILSFNVSLCLVIFSLFSHSYILPHRYSLFLLSTFLHTIKISECLALCWIPIYGTILGRCIIKIVLTQTQFLLFVGLTLFLHSLFYLLILSSYSIPPFRIQ